MKAFKRDKNVITYQQDLEHLYTFKDFPVFMGCVEGTDVENDVTADMSWWISRGSGSIQLNPVPDLDLIYPSSHGSGTIGKSWEAHHIQLAEFILKYAGKKVLEIGGGHGFLANLFLKERINSKWTLIDPNPSCESKENLKVIKGFFPLETDKIYDTIVHSHLFEHMVDPADFCCQISNQLEEGGYLIFSVPNLGEMLERKYTNVINFEHTYFLNDYYTEYLLSQAGLEVVEKKLFLSDHSIFYAVKKTGNENPVKINNQYSKNLKLYKDYIDYHEAMIADLNKQIDDAKGNVYLFGGHVMSQFLLAFGLNQSKISNIIDNDKNKWGKRLNGTTLIVQSPQLIQKDNEPLVILRAGAFQSEIADQLEKINRNVKIIPSTVPV